MKCGDAVDQPNRLVVSGQLSVVRRDRENALAFAGTDNWQLVTGN
jgi:hypothetical protein